MQVLLYDFRWDTSEVFEFQASKDGRFGTKPLQIGSDISISVRSDVQCGGSRREGDFQICPNQIVGRKKCETCRAREGSFVVTSFDGFNTGMFTAEDLARLDGDHVVYLAFFSEKLCKIGVSKLSRKTLRQVEQGSQYTLYIAQTPDGVVARQIETLFRQQGIADKISASTKKDFLCPDSPPEKAFEILKSMLDTHKNCLDAEPHLKNFLLEKPEFVDWSEVYGVQDIESHEKSFHSVKLDKDEWVSGKIIACKGPFLVIETPEELVSLSAKDLVGREIEFDALSPGLGLQSAFQSALF